jgi:uncharacterized protein
MMVHSGSSADASNPVRSQVFSMTDAGNHVDRVAIREDLLTMPLNDPRQISLVGSTCSKCGETFLGRAAVCANCGTANPEPRALSKRGVLWTYTVVRHKPPGDYKGPEPFIPFGLGLVEMPEGLRVLAPIVCDLSELRIGMPLQFHAFVRPGSHSTEVVVFEFVPVE